MKNNMKHVLILFLTVSIFSGGCGNGYDEQCVEPIGIQMNLLDYSANPESAQDRNYLAFSDQGAWFAYGFPTDKKHLGGFAGPFLMTQQNGVWCSKILSQLVLTNLQDNTQIKWDSFTNETKSFPSHLQLVYTSEHLDIEQTLFFLSPHSAIISTRLQNKSERELTLKREWKGKTWLKSLQFQSHEKGIQIHSEESPATGFIQVVGELPESKFLTDSSYAFQLEEISVPSKKSTQFFLTQSLIFPAYDWKEEAKLIQQIPDLYDQLFQQRIEEKVMQFEGLQQKLDSNWQEIEYQNLLAKTLLTLQNNYRVAAGELKYNGLFPSYHYKWFHGFWAWDSWKHAAALAHFNAPLAKDQIRSMYVFMDGSGFIADCIYRDTTIENHNYRNTKPPLSAWAVWKIFEQDKDSGFLQEIYPKIIQQHYWWYQNRDHDRDGICEYGSTDGTLIAAKWESGMDNAVRFDNSKILKNSDHAYSLNQESVDLNAYLFAEKNYLKQMALILGKDEDVNKFNSESKVIKRKIQYQFFDAETGWFYDTSIDGATFIRAMGCEGWIPLWAEVATIEQAEAVKMNMLNPDMFNTKVPFQTLSASHPDFKPDGGYWRGPNWLDQAYFGVVGLKNYGYHSEVQNATCKLIHNAKGVLEKGVAIRENYNPVTGEGLEAYNFSWSAAHYLLLLIDE